MNLIERKKLLNELLAKVVDVPREWFGPNVAAAPHTGNKHATSVEAVACGTWAECEAAWKEAMQWRRDLGDALAVLMAVAASTQQAGNQLFLDLVGSPGSAKTTMCRGLLVSSHCIHLENMTKLISGYKLPGDAERDCSFLARANGKTWITCEFDTVLTSPQYVELMGKIRRIFDGETTATYGNSDKDRVYSALRTPWIRAGTHKMMDHDQSQLGDRFMRFIINDPGDEEKRAIARAALRSERAAMLETANGMATSILDPKTRRAYALTGGYVDWLRAHVEEELGKVAVPEAAEDHCLELAELSADMRARPNTDPRKTETYDSKELPTRLSRQNFRLAMCLAVVMNKPAIDDDVLRIVRKVALDTAIGHTQDMVRWLCGPDPKAPHRSYQEGGGIAEKTLEMWTGMPIERMRGYLAFLRKIKVISKDVTARPGVPMVKLTDRVYELYLKVNGKNHAGNK